MGCKTYAQLMMHSTGMANLGTMSASYLIRYKCQVIVLQYNQISHCKLKQGAESLTALSAHQIQLLIRDDQASVTLLEPQEHLGLGQWAAQTTRLLNRVRSHRQVCMRVQLKAAVRLPFSALAALQHNLQGRLHILSIWQSFDNLYTQVSNSLSLAQGMQLKHAALLTRSLMAILPVLCDDLHRKALPKRLLLSASPLMTPGARLHHLTAVQAVVAQQLHAAGRCPP